LSDIALNMRNITGPDKTVIIGPKDMKGI